MAVSKTCPKRGCSRPLNHNGNHGKIRPAELVRLVPGSNGSIPDINLWHEINK